MMYYSAKELCCLYPEKYIAVKVIEQSYPDTEILKCQVLKVYNTLDDCKKRANELRLFQKLFKEQFDVICCNNTTSVYLVDLTVRTDTDVEAEVTIMEIREVLDEEDMCEEVLKIFNQFKTKQAICNGMSKLYKDSKKASEVYKKLRPLLQKKKKK